MIEERNEKKGVAPYLLLLLLTAVSVFLVLIRVLVSAASVARLKAAEQAVSRQMELGRAYRHDMRHHLMILDGLAREKNFAGITKYIEGLRGKLSLTEKENFCENPTVNAVLSGYVAQAREAGCAVSIKAALPKELPFDELDVCAVLANALENAINACRKETEKRYIRLSAELEAQRRLTVLGTNPCKRPVSFDDEGFPMTPKQEGHGIGLRSIDAVEKNTAVCSAANAERGNSSFRRFCSTRLSQRKLCRPCSRHTSPGLKNWPLRWRWAFLPSLC